MRGSMIVEFEYEEEDISVQSIERQMDRAIKRQFEATPLTVLHLECSAGDLSKAFGVGSVVPPLSIPDPHEHACCVCLSVYPCSSVWICTREDATSTCGKDACVAEYLADVEANKINQEMERAKS